MASKNKKSARVSKHPLPLSKKIDVRRRVTSRALSNDEKCTMKLVIYLSKNDEWFLHKNSCLDHCNHHPIAAEAMAKRSNEMTNRDVSMVSNLLYVIFI
jgi:hypothetical protein